MSRAGQGVLGRHRDADGQGRRPRASPGEVAGRAPRLEPPGCGWPEHQDRDDAGAAGNGWRARQGRDGGDIPSDDKIDLWVKEQNAKGQKCACGCGRMVAVYRRHYWMGLPKFHGECRHRAMQAKRASVAGGKYINGTELAQRLGIGRSTLKRWVKAGKLPKPEKGISGMLLFRQEQIEPLEHNRRRIHTARPEPT